MTQSQQVIDELYTSYTTTAANIISYYEGEERKEMLKELRQIVEINCRMQIKLKEADAIKNNLMGKHNKDDTDIEAIIEEYKNSIVGIETDVSNENQLLEYDREVKALLDQNREEVGKTQDDEDEDEDDDLQLSGGFVNVIDPITKKRIVDPVKNTVCGHTYDREGITELLKCNKKTRCPVIGCKSTQFVTLAQLKTDIVTKTYLEKHPAN